MRYREFLEDGGFVDVKVEAEMSEGGQKLWTADVSICGGGRSNLCYFGFWKRREDEREVEDMRRSLEIVKAHIEAGLAALPKSGEP